jgi:hypothetical protein
VSESQVKQKVQPRVFWLFFKPSCAICENLLKSKSFQRLRRILARGDGIELELYNAEDGSYGEALADILNINFVPCLVDPLTGERKKIAFRSVSELEATLAPKAGFIEETLKEEKEGRKSLKIRKIEQTIRKHFPTEWFSLADIRQHLPGINISTIKSSLFKLKERGILAHDPFNKKYKLIG